jgi:outer membrane lipoprotein-sorting protein
MLKRRTTLFVSLLILATGITTAAQDFKTVFAAMKVKHEHMSTFHVVMKVEAKDNENAKPFYHERFEMKKDDDHFLYGLSNSVILLGDKHVIEVDKTTRNMVVNKRDLKIEKSLTKQIRFDLDSMLTFYETPAYLGEKNGQYWYRLAVKEGPIKTIDLDVNETSGLLSQIKYRYRDGQLVTIVFDVFDTEPVFGANTFSEEKFFIEERGLIQPVGDYKDFRAIKVDSK